MRILYYLSKLVKNKQVYVLDSTLYSKIKTMHSKIDSALNVLKILSSVNFDLTSA